MERYLIRIGKLGLTVIPAKKIECWSKDLNLLGKIERILALEAEWYKTFFDYENPIRKNKFRIACHSCFGFVQFLCCYKLDGG